MQPTSETDIQLIDVTKVFQTGIFKRKVGVRDLSLSVPRGEVVGLLGANGSGKSTTLKMILGFLRPSKGHLFVCGVRANSLAARRQIGYLPENPRFQKFLCAEDILRYFGKLHRLSGLPLENRIRFLLELVGLQTAARERVQGFSKGMTQRLAIAQALINQPKVLIFDEPMSGLDPLGRIEIRRLIKRIHHEMPTCTLFFSTHILSDVEALCSSVALLKKGVLEIHCPISELLKPDTEHFQVTASELSPALSNQMIHEFCGEVSPLGVTFEVKGSEKLTAALNAIQKDGAKVLGLNSKRKGLEETLFSDTPLEARP